MGKRVRRFVGGLCFAVFAGTPLLAQQVDALGSRSENLVKSPIPASSRRHVFLREGVLTDLEKRDLESRLASVLRGFDLLLLVLPGDSGKIPWESLVPNNEMLAGAILVGADGGALDFSLNDAAGGKLDEDSRKKLAKSFSELDTGKLAESLRRGAFLLGNAMLGVESLEPVADIPVQEPTVAPVAPQATPNALSTPRMQQPQLPTASPRPAPEMTSGDHFGLFIAKVIWHLKHYAKPIAVALLGGILLVVAFLTFRASGKRVGSARARPFPENPVKPRLGGRVGGGHTAVVSFAGEATRNESPTNSDDTDES